MAGNAWQIVGLFYPPKQAMGDLGIGNFQAQKFAKEEHLILPKDEALRSRLIEGIAAMFESISVLSSKLSNLRRTRDLLLPRLLSGQVNLETIA